jgi:hypothetical protein
MSEIQVRITNDEEGWELIADLDTIPAPILKDWC